VEPDSSIDVDDNDDQGLEFVSPPLPIEELLNDLNKVKAWADRTGCYTNDSTGLHINVSVPGWTQGTDQLDYVKLALLLGDEFVLDSFGRAGNTYAKSAMGKIRDAVRKSPDRAQELMDRMKSGMDQLASKVVHSRSTEKYTSINVKDGYIEFRSPGGDWLNDNFAEIDNTLRRFTVALSAAVDPEAYRQEYLKKLYKLLDVSGEKDPLSYFAKFAAGELPKAALKSFVRQAQLERGVNRGKETGPMVWKVSNPPQSLASIEVVANSKEEAIKRATAQDGYPSWANTINSVVAEPLRPYKQEPVAPQTQGVDTRVDYELYSRASGAVIDTFPARNDDEAITRLSDYINFGAGQSNPDNFDVRRAGRAPIAGSTLDLQRQRAAASAAAAQIPTIDIDVEPAPAPQPAGMGQWNGQWKVLVGGQEVYRFGGVGNSQADANRIAAAWLRQNGQGVSGEGFEVYPVMAESLREYRMPQPSHGPGKYRDLNEPLGPEVKENFADGENPVKFTVSSLDGYQYSFQITLAVHGKHVGHFNFVRSADTDDVNNEAEVEQRWQGQGYGKLLLMKAIDVANNHGLDFQQDIRGITDAQQNVYDSLENAGLIVTPGDGFWFLTPQGEQELNGLNENFADGKNPGRKGLAKRSGVNTKASVSSLRKTAKNSSGEKQRMAHWLANMKAGRAKAKRK
jgi:GNAT superfamily N-acetyltransferase